MLAQPISDWHADQNARNRDPQACLEFYLVEVQGRGLSCLARTFDLLGDMEMLENIGFPSAFSIKAVSKVNPAQLEDLEEWAGQAFTFCFELAKQRLRYILMLMFGFPNAFVLALSDNPEDHQWLLTWMRRCWCFWAGLEENPLRTTAFWKTVKKGHVFNWEMNRVFLLSHQQQLCHGDSIDEGIGTGHLQRDWTERHQRVRLS